MAQESMKFSLIRLNNFMRDRTLKGLEGTDLKACFTPVLVALGDADGLTVSELSHITGLDKSNVTVEHVLVVVVPQLHHAVSDAKAHATALDRWPRPVETLLNRGVEVLGPQQITAHRREHLHIL